MSLRRGEFGESREKRGSILMRKGHAQGRPGRSFFGNEDRRQTPAFVRMGWKMITGPTHTAAAMNTDAPGSFCQSQRLKPTSRVEADTLEGEEGSPQVGLLLMFLLFYYKRKFM